MKSQHQRKTRAVLASSTAAYTYLAPTYWDGVTGRDLSHKDSLSLGMVLEGAKPNASQG